MLACAFGAQAQTESYPFDPADLDANGWLWFDTAEKIEKYVGVSEDGKLDPDGKVFQMITTESASNVKPPFNKTFASDTITGFANDKFIDLLKKGAIVLNGASDNGNKHDGGALLINLPSCKKMHMFLSCNASVWVYLSGTNDAEADTSAYNVVYKPSKSELWPGGPIFINPLFSGLNNPFEWTSHHWKL